MELARRLGYAEAQLAREEATFCLLKVFSWQRVFFFVFFVVCFSVLLLFCFVFVAVCLLVCGEALIRENDANFQKAWKWEQEQSGVKPFVFLLAWLIAFLLARLLVL